MAFDIEQVRFNENGLVPAVVQEAASGDVLMVAYMNAEALQKTIRTGKTWFYSRSRNKLWQKGETSGHEQIVRDLFIDCDGDTILVRVDQQGAGACHKGYTSCFHTRIGSEQEGPSQEQTFDPDAVYRDEATSRIVDELYEVIATRKRTPVEGSYTTYLFTEGIDKILKKVGEESAEVIIAGKGADGRQLVMESADLMYHLLVLLVAADVAPEQLWRELQTRRGGGGSEDAAPGK